MRYCIKIILTLLTVGHIACGQNSKSSLDKVIIDLNAVDFVTIRKWSRNDTIAYEPIKLTSSQTKIIIDKWNNSKGTGPRKYLPTFEMTVYLNDKGTRNFRINAQYIKENNDWCYDLGDADFVEKLLKSVR
jgi:hypothetical protein